MSRTISRRLLSQSTQSLIPDLTASTQLPLRCLRPFSQSARRRATDETSPPAIDAAAPPQQATPSSASTPAPISDRFSYGQPTVSPSINPRASTGSMSKLSTFAELLDQNNLDRQNARRNASFDLLSASGSVSTRPPHQLHVYASRHNCHITLWGPPKSVRMNKKKDKETFKGGAILSISAGQIGFRHSGRKHYDSAFQLASYVFARMAEAGVSQDVVDLELYLRGFGSGREAVTKALLGAEGKLLRGKVRKVADTTRLKFGGTRSPKPRRLG